jgi:hypothetical protein
MTQTVFSGLASKPMMTVFFGLASKPVAQVSRFGHQNRQFQFCDLCLKIIATISWCDLKTKQASVYLLRYKTDGGRMTRDTHRDLAACFA